MSKRSIAFVIATAASAPLILAAAPLQDPVPSQSQARAIAPAVDGDEHKGHDKTVCPVTGKTIPEGKGVKVTVRGREYTVIDQAAADKLTANPDKFLTSDGRPKKAEKAEKKTPKGQ
ncbi:MAG: hypothetical protein HY014_16500 [Acidobacteria bacterium]|nr:hypothetical protein [Acidobacteriota bacterium]MBI3489731.1 hypothetical protein [Acidobacteriota bacterium]